MEQEAADGFYAYMIQQCAPDGLVRDIRDYFRALLEYLIKHIELYRMVAMSVNSLPFYMRFRELVKNRLMKMMTEHHGELSEAGMVEFLFFFQCGQFAGV